MSGARGKEPVAVPARAERTGETGGPRWSWVEPLVWTERMLTALDEGVKGGKWYSLMDKVYPERTLRAAFTKVAANRGAAGVDHVTVEMYASRLDDNLKRLSEDLRTGRYRPQAIRRHYIPKPGSQEKRPLGIPTVHDRVAQTALRMVLEPIFERDFAAHSYGFRPRRGAKDALRRVDELLGEGYSVVVDADLRSYFDTIPHDRLMALISQRVVERSILKLIEGYLGQGVLDGLQEWTPTMGTPQGAVISPLLSNIYLDPLDQLMARQGYEMVRYADDFVVLCRSRQEAEAALAVVQEWTTQAGLMLHPDKTRLVDACSDGFEFLGYRFDRGRKWPRDKSLDKFKEAVRAKTPRNSGKSLTVIIADLNRPMRGWFEYFQHCYHTTFSSLDGWIRRRLRSLLRRRTHGKGISKGADHQRWPNHFFAEHGLYSLQEAHALARRSPRG